MVLDWVLCNMKQPTEKDRFILLYHNNDKSNWTLWYVKKWNIIMGCSQYRIIDKLIASSKQRIDDLTYHSSYETSVWNFENGIWPTFLYQTMDQVLKNNWDLFLLYPNILDSKYLESIDNE